MVRACVCTFIDGGSCYIIHKRRGGLCKHFTRMNNMNANSMYFTLCLSSAAALLARALRNPYSAPIPFTDARIAFMLTSSFPLITLRLILGTCYTVAITSRVTCAIRADTGGAPQ